MTPENIFEIKSDCIDCAKELIKEYEFCLKDISIPIKLRFYRILGRTVITFTQSHFIKSPIQADYYQTSQPSNENLCSALNQVVSGITDYYEIAIGQGLKPDQSWLKKNDDF